MKKYIIIKADTNDADYFTEVSEITDEQIELIKPVIEAIKNAPKDKHGWGHNYETGEAVDKADAEELYGHLEGFKTFDKFVPNGDENYPGVHTIESIMIVSEVEKLFSNG
jgi:hypothetical protein